jgi:hypothetical protein
MSLGENLSSKITVYGILLSIAIGVWVIVLQNLGVIPISQRVKVVGMVDAYVSGSVDIDNTVDVEVSNTVDVNLEEVIGHSVGCRRSYTIDGTDYHSIDVSIR